MGRKGENNMNAPNDNLARFEQPQAKNVTPMGPKPNICQRLNAIKKAVAYIQKDKEVSGAGTYMAVTHDAVTAATRAQFVEHGVLTVPCELSSATVDSGMVTGKGNPIIRFEAKYRVDFVNVDEPTEKVS